MPDVLGNCSPTTRNTFEIPILTWHLSKDNANSLHMSEGQPWSCEACKWAEKRRCEALLLPAPCQCVNVSNQVILGRGPYPYRHEVNDTHPPRPSAAPGPPAQKAAGWGSYGPSPATWGQRQAVAGATDYAVRQCMVVNYRWICSRAPTRCRRK